MADFGGMGGITGGRPIDQEDLFEAAVNRCMGDRLRAEGPGECRCDFRGETLGERLWGTLANAEFEHKELGHTAGYTFRAAGDMIAAIIGAGDYMHWYCSADYDLKDEEVLRLLATEGWTYKEPVDE